MHTAPNPQPLRKSPQSGLPHPLRAAMALLLAAALVLPAMPAQAQDEEDASVTALFNRSTDHMERGEWQEALNVLNRLIEIYGGNDGQDGMRDFGPSFGLMYYRRGFCYKNLGEFDQAIAEYTKSFEQFANKDDTPAGQQNPVWELSALEIGACHQALGSYSEALEWYEKFASLSPDPHMFDVAAFRLQMAVCYVKTGNLERGREVVNQVFDRVDGARARPDALYRGFLSLVEGWVSPGQGEEQSMEQEALEFIRERRDMLAVTPYDKGRYQFNNRLLIFARQASERGMFSLAVQLFGMMSSPSEILADLNTRAARLPNPPQNLLDEIALYEEMRTAENSIEIIALVSLANTYERMNNFRPGYTIYTQLVLDHPGHELRPDFLYGATRCAIAVRDVPGAVHFGMTFREEFPGHAYAAMVNALLIESLFYAGRYTEVLDIAQRVRRGMEPGAPERDMPDFAIACSLFYLGRHAEAEGELEAHLETYPESAHREVVSFCYAANMVRLNDFATAGERLDVFLEEFPDSTFRPYALLERADCHFRLDQISRALERTDTLIQENPAFVEMDRVMGLRGDCHMVSQNYEQAKQNYTRSLELANRGGPGRADNAARALVQLAAIAVETGELAEAVEYYDQYMAAHRGGFYDAQLVVTSMPALIDVGRTEEALEELEGVIVRVGSGEVGVGLEEAVNSYVQFYLDEIGPQELYQRLIDFPVPAGMEVNDELQAWLLISRIRILEDDAFADQFPEREAETTLVYNQLRAFDKEVLAPFIAVSVGLMLVDMGTPEALEEAGELFDSIIQRGPATDNYAVALLGRAQLLARSDDTADREQALQLFDRAITDLEDSPRDVERATLAKGKLLFEMQRWNEAAEVFLHATEQRNWTQERALVYFLLGRSYEEAGEYGGALGAYFAFFAPPHESYVQFSAEARLRSARIREQTDNKQEAYNLLRLTLQRMHRFDGDENLRGELPFQTINNPIGEAKQMYVRLQRELGIQGNAAEELTWNLPQS